MTYGMSLTDSKKQGEDLEAITRYVFESVKLANNEIHYLASINTTIFMYLKDAPYVLMNMRGAYELVIEEAIFKQHKQRYEFMAKDMGSLGVNNQLVLLEKTLGEKLYKAVKKRPRDLVGRFVKGKAIVPLWAKGTVMLAGGIIRYLAATILDVLFHEFFPSEEYRLIYRTLEDAEKISKKFATQATKQFNDVLDNTETLIGILQHQYIDADDENKETLITQLKYETKVLELATKQAEVNYAKYSEQDLVDNLNNNFHLFDLFKEWAMLNSGVSGSRARKTTHFGPEKGAWKEIISKLHQSSLNSRYINGDGIFWCPYLYLKHIECELRLLGVKETKIEEFYSSYKTPTMFPDGSIFDQLNALGTKTGDVKRAFETQKQLGNSENPIKLTHEDIDYLDMFQSCINNAYTSLDGDKEYPINIVDNLTFELELSVKLRIPPYTEIVTKSSTTPSGTYVTCVKEFQYKNMKVNSSTVSDFSETLNTFY